ncbi:MAG: phosphate signaling complex protein PhoU [candidate division Zixibacteria bacterium]|nr:phosphate signaling complex protein PhoU [candidate division Zixibacteria bacterium]
MPHHLQREIEKLKKKILSLCASVEENVRMAVKSIEDRDAALAERVVGQDPEIDQSEVDLEEDCLKILALHQPVAIDLRFIIAVLKINSDLERIGDLAVNIAERAQFLSTQPRIAIPFDLDALAEKTQDMLKKSLDSLVNLNTALARDVCRTDDDVDEINREMYDLVKDAIRAHPEQLDILIPYLSVSRYLERIADHATNIAEDVIYMIEGVITRHSTGSF